MRDKYRDHLKSVPLFSDLGRHELDVIARAATDLSADAGTVLLQEGDLAQEMVIVVAGQLEVTRGGRHIADLGPGDFAGEMALLARSTRHATVTAKTSVELVHIDGRSFQGILDEAPQIAVKMLPIVAARAVENSSD